MDNKLHVSSVLTRTLSICARNFLSFTIMLALIFSPLVVLMLSRAQEQTPLASALGLRVLVMFGGLFLSVVASAAVTHTVFEQLSGRRATFATSMAVGLKRCVPVFQVGVVMMIIIGLGFTALVIPGVIVGCMWFVALPVTVVEKQGVLISLTRSQALTKGARGHIFAAMFMLMIANVVGMVILRGVILGGETTPTELRTFMLAYVCLSAVFAGMGAVMSCVIYHDLRGANEGADTKR